MIGAKPGTPKGHNPDPATGHRATSLVGFGSNSEVRMLSQQVGFALNNGHHQASLSCPKSANRRHHAFIRSPRRHGAVYLAVMVIRAARLAAILLHIARGL